MPYEIISQGVTIVIPTSGTKNWATTLKNSTWVKISQHDHSGSGNEIMELDFMVPVL